MLIYKREGSGIWRLLCVAPEAQDGAVVLLAVSALYTGNVFGYSLDGGETVNEGDPLLAPLFAVDDSAG